MTDLSWQKWFEIGDDTIDLEHQTFFFLVKRLKACVEEGRSRVETRRLMEEVIKYSEFHFTSEENIMANIQYEKIEEHKEHHRDLMANLRDNVSLYDSGADNARDIVDFLLRWLLEHTIREDMNIAKAIKEKNLDRFFGGG